MDLQSLPAPSPVGEHALALLREHLGGLMVDNAFLTARLANVVSAHQALAVRAKELDDRNKALESQLTEAREEKIT